MFHRVNFLDSLAGIGLSPTIDVFEELAEAYGANTRHYHDQTHVAECLGALGAIRKEYAWVPEEQYRPARANVLKGFLDRTAIFHLDEFRNAFELQARHNIEGKLNELVG